MAPRNWRREEWQASAVAISPSGQPHVFLLFGFFIFVSSSVMGVGIATDGALSRNRVLWFLAIGVAIFCFQQSI